MNWKHERDLFVAQTLAFVQSLSGHRPRVERAAQSKPSENIEPARDSESTLEPKSTIEITSDVDQSPESKPVSSLKTFEPPTVQLATKVPPAASELRKEIADHISTFRAHQQRFHREREEYYTATLARAQATTARDPTTRTKETRTEPPAQPRAQ